MVNENIKTLFKIMYVWCIYVFFVIPTPTLGGSHTYIHGKMSKIP